MLGGWGHAESVLMGDVVNMERYRLAREMRRAKDELNVFVLVWLIVMFEIGCWVPPRLEATLMST